MLSRLLPVSWQCHTVVPDHTLPNLSPTTPNHTTIIHLSYGPFLLKLLVTVKIMYIKKKFFKCAINVVKAVQVNISNAYTCMKLQSMNCEILLVEELKV